MRILFIGDIFGKSGRKSVTENLPTIIKQQKIDFVIANGENATHGRSLVQDNYDDLIKAGVNLVTMGNHTWDISSIYKLLDDNQQIIRPYNVDGKENQHGVGTIICEVNNKKIQVTNLISTMCNTRANVNNPFKAMEKILKQAKDIDLQIVDFHAETTSEKNAFLICFAGKVSLVVGTHTHVQTADEKIYKDTAFITDVGMCGPKESIIGAKPQEIIDMFKGDRPRFHLEPAKGPYQFNSIICEFDEKTNKPIKINRFNINNN